MKKSREEGMKRLWHINHYQMLKIYRITVISLKTCFCVCEKARSFQKFNVPSYLSVIDCAMIKINLHISPYVSVHHLQLPFQISHHARTLSRNAIYEHHAASSQLLCQSPQKSTHKARSLFRVVVFVFNVKDLAQCFEFQITTWFLGLHSFLSFHRLTSLVPLDYDEDPSSYCLYCASFFFHFYFFRTEQTRPRHFT